MQKCSYPSLATSHLAIKCSTALPTFNYSSIAKNPACPHLKTKNQSHVKHSNKGEAQNSSVRTHEPHHSALMSGSATGALPNSSPGHHLDHSQSRVMCTSSQREQEITPCLGAVAGQSVPSSLGSQGRSQGSRYSERVGISAKTK